MSDKSLHAETRRKAGVSQTLGDVLQSEQAHSGVPVHCPFLGFTVWLAAVVHEASLVAFGSCVNDPILKERAGRMIKGSRGEDVNQTSVFPKKNVQQIWGDTPKSHEMLTCYHFANQNVNMFILQVNVERIAREAKRIFGAQLHRLGMSTTNGLN